MEIPDDLSLVSSLYGPGNWGCWCLTIISLLLTWTFNIESRQKDTITNDFLAALAIPCIAAGHLIWLVFFDDNTQLITYVDYSISEIRASHPTVMKHLLAAEGPLRICRIFTVLHMALALISANKGHFKRMWLTLCAGCLVMMAQESVQWWSDTAAAPASEERPVLFRPYSPGLSFNLHVFHFALIMVHFSRPFLDKVKGNPSCGGRHLRSAENTEHQQAPGDKDYENDHTQQPTENDEDQLKSRAFCYLCAQQYWDISELRSILLACIPLRAELTTEDDDGYGLIPRSSIKINELDQVVTLMVGLITLGCTLRDIIKANRREMKTREKARMREETGIGEERLLYLNTIVNGWMENQRDLEGQPPGDHASNERLDRLKSQKEIFMKIMAKEKLFERRSMEHEWFRRKINGKVTEDALKSIKQPGKVYVPSQRATSSVRARMR